MRTSCTYLSSYTPTNNYSPNRIAQSCSATWSRLLWSNLERTFIGAWNTSGMIISIIQMNVRIELGDHKQHPAVASSRGGPWASKFYQRYIYCTRRLSPDSEPFSDEHGDESFRSTCREFNFAGESPWRKWQGRARWREGKGFYSYRERACLPSARERV